MTVFSNNYVIFKRGEKMRRDGMPCPPHPNLEDEDDRPITDAEILWIGYRCEMAREFDERKAVAVALNLPEPQWREEPWPAL